MTQRRYHLEQVLHNFPDGVLTLDQELRISYANPALCSILGFDTDELIGSSIQSYLGDLSILESCQMEVLENGFCREQVTVFKRKDGTAVQVSKNVQLLQDDLPGGGTTFIISIRDLTNLQELNEQLTESTQLLERYNDNLSALVLSRTESLHEKMASLEDYKNAIDTSNMVSKCGLDQVVIYVNQALCERSGYNAAELIGQKITFLCARILGFLTSNRIES